MLANVLAVIRREYLQRVRSKWFVIVTIGGPLLMIGVFVVPAYFASEDDRTERRLLIVDGTDVLYDRVAPELREGGYTVDRERWHADVVSELRERVLAEEIGGFLFLDALTLETGEAALYTADRPSAIRRLSLRSAIARAALEYQLEQRGVDAEAMLGGGELTVEMLTDEAPGAEGAQFGVAYMGAFFMYMGILLYAVSVMRATLEEKTNRIVEVIISAMKPWHLMLGKILGVGAVGLTQMGAWLLSGALLFAAGLPALIAARPELADLGEISDALPGVRLLALFLAFFVFGFFMYSGLYAAVGAMCSTDEEAQQAQFPLIMLLVVPIIMVIGVIESPMTPLSTGLSLFPLFTPILMWARVVGGNVPAWEVGLSFVLMGLTIVGVAWVAGRIYKVGVLMAGKRPTLPELWRWVRQSG